MNEIITFESMEALYRHIQSRGGATTASHGALGTFFILMGAYTNPNTCSCKKGKNALNNIMAACRAFSGTTGDVRNNCKSLFDNKMIIVKENGTEIVRF
jgi:hypothetical protein